MIPSEYMDQVSALLELMQVVIDISCDSKLSVNELAKRISSFKTDLKIYQVYVNSWRREGEFSSECLAELDAKLASAKTLLCQLEAELQTRIWEKFQGR